MLAYYELPVGGKSQAPACSVSDKGSHAGLKPFMVFQPKPLNVDSLQNPSQAFQWRPCAISSVQVTPHKLP